MTITIELTPEIESSLQVSARASGVPLEKWLQSAVEQMARGQASTRAGTHTLDAALDRLAAMGRNLPSLPNSALTRESFYSE